MLFLFDLLGTILEVETDGELEVELAGAALVLSAECVEQFEVDLWSVEGAITFINLILLAELPQRILQLRLCQIPILKPTQILLRSSRKFNLIFKTKHRVNVINEVKNSKNLLLNLLRHAEDVSIILLESPHSG